ncbi:MAG: leucyl aminopeptidase [Leptothrix sp. (in: b-proteobacteria)]
MDVQTLLAAPDEFSAINAEALLLLLPIDRQHWHVGAELTGLLDDLVVQGDLVLKSGRTLSLLRPAGLAAARLIVAVLGDASPKAWRSAVQAAVGVLKNSGAKSAAIASGGDMVLDQTLAALTVTAVSEAMYVYRHTKPTAPVEFELRHLQLVCAPSEAAAVQIGVQRGQAVAAGVTLARECANRPGNHATPTYLAEQAKLLAKEFGLKVKVLDQQEVEKLGMGAFLAVAKGSDEPLRFIVLRYEGAGKKDAPVVLVGKGITFDSGGISIKAAAEMDEMKFDMCGAASVLGTFRAVAELKPKINLIGLIPACENMPSGRATKPGDVITSLSGKTIEVLNTDAEGRLVLCDALTYAERFKPAAVVDIATLTGACVIALGHHHTGLFSADEALASALLEAGRSAQDSAWRMPLDAEYDEALKSNFADMGNTGPRPGGATTAAMFLKRYTGAYRWAHLDIAGTAWKSGAAKGATGRPVGLLTHFVLSQAV